MATDLLSGEYEYVEMVLDSQQATVGFNGYDPLDWPLYKLNYPLGNIAQMKVLEVGIPTVWGSIQAGNNTFTLVLPGPPQYTVTIPPASYTATTFCAALQTALTTAYSGTTWTVTWNPTSYRYTVSTSAPAINFSFLFTDTPTTPGVLPVIFSGTVGIGNIQPYRYMGFNYGLQGGTTSLTCPNAPVFSGPNWVYLNSSKIGRLFQTMTAQGLLFDGNINPIVAKIPITSGLNAFNVWQDPAPDLWHNMDGLYNLQELDFYLTSPENNVLLMKLGWYVKIGILYRNTSATMERSSQNATNRVIKRIRPQ